MRKIYVYGRLALTNEEDKKRKIEVIDNYCKANNLIVDKYFFDNGVSGLELNRKDLNTLIDVLRGGDIVVTDGVASISRNMLECMTVIDLIEKIGAKLIIIR